MKPSHHVIIHHPCTFTRTAIKAIITSQGDKYDINETSCLNAFIHKDDQPPIDNPVLLITFIPRSILSFVNTLYAIETLQRQSAHSLIALVLTNDVIRPLAMSFLNKYPDKCFFLEELVSCRELSEKVKKLLGNDGDKEVGEVLDERDYLPSPLTNRERQVIKRLLKGAPAGKIANELGLNYKTVNHYKMSALKKLGFRNINAIFSVKWNLRTKPYSRYL